MSPARALRNAPETRRLAEEREFFGAGQGLHGVLDAQGDSLAAAALRREQFERAATAGVARAFARLVLRQPGADVASDAAVERAVRAAYEVDGPGHGSDDDTKGAIRLALASSRALDSSLASKDEGRAMTPNGFKVWARRAVALAVLGAVIGAALGFWTNRSERASKQRLEAADRKAVVSFNGEAQRADEEARELAQKIAHLEGKAERISKETEYARQHAGIYTVEADKYREPERDARKRRDAAKANAQSAQQRIDAARTRPTIARRSLLLALLFGAIPAAIAFRFLLQNRVDSGAPRGQAG